MLGKAQTISDKWILSGESLSPNSAALEEQEEWMSLGRFFPVQKPLLLLPTQVVAPTGTRLPHLQQTHVSNFVKPEDPPHTHTHIVVTAGRGSKCKYWLSFLVAAWLLSGGLTGSGSNDGVCPLLPGATLSLFPGKQLQEIKMGWLVTGYLGAPHTRLKKGGGQETASSRLTSVWTEVKVEERKLTAWRRKRSRGWMEVGPVQTTMSV